METVADPIRGGFVICRPLPIFFDTFSQPIGITLMSDLHVGAVNVDYELIKEEIQRAKDKGDRVCINGDIFDFILMGDHKRYKQDVLHPRLLGRKNVVNEAIKWGAELLRPVVNQIDMIGYGNHETSIEAHNSYDPIQALIYELEGSKEKKEEHLIHYGGYTGFIDYRIRYQNKKQTQSPGSNGKRIVIYYHHGGGANAPVTKGMIDFHRKDTFVDSDVIWLGHKHNRFTSHVRKLACPEQGDQPSVRDVRHVMTGAYFDTYVGQSQESIRKDGRRASWAADSGFAPQGKGGARLEITPTHPKHNSPTVFDIRVVQ